MSKVQQVPQRGPDNPTSHIIRLHGPWQYEPLAITELGADGRSVDLPGDLPPPGTVKIPADWTATIGPDFRGRVLYRRRFGRPSNLDPAQRVDLVLTRISGFATITLDGRLLGAMKPGDLMRRFELTNLLRSRNELQIEVNLPRGQGDVASGGIVGEVHLEIHTGIK